MAQDGVPVQFLIPRDFGVRFVANSVVTSRDMVRERPALVRRFIQALLEGWEAALDPANNDRIMAMLQAFDKDTPEAQLQAQLVITRELVKPEGVAVGSIDTEAWIQTEQIMLDQNQIAKPVDVKSALRPEFAF